MSVVDHVGDYADVPVLHVTGWYDSWTRQVTMNYEALSRAKKSPQRLVIGPWVHGARARTSPARSSSPPTRRSTCWPFACGGTTAGCKGIKNGVDDDPPVLLYIMGTGDDRRSGAAGSSTAASGGPSTNGRSPGPGRRPLYLHADGRLARARPRADGRRDDLHVRPAASGADDRRQHLLEPGPDHHRRLRPAAPRRHPRRRQSPAALRAARRPGLPDARRWRPTWRSPARSRSSSGSARRPPTPTSRPS